MKQFLKIIGCVWIGIVIYNFFMANDLLLYHGAQLASSLFSWFIIMFPGVLFLVMSKLIKTKK